MASSTTALLGVGWGWGGIARLPQKGHDKMGQKIKKHWPGLTSRAGQEVEMKRKGPDVGND